MKLKFVRVASLSELKPAAAVSACEKQNGGAHASTRERASWLRHFMRGDAIDGLEVWPKPAASRRVSR